MRYADPAAQKRIDELEAEVRRLRLQASVAGSAAAWALEILNRMAADASR